MRQHNYFVYLTTDNNKGVLYTGLTNNLPQRMIEHYLNKGKSRTFGGRFYCYNLLHFERYQYIQDVYKREKQIKGWTRAKKIALIESENPGWRFLNEDTMEWPPAKDAESRSAYQKS